MSRFGRGGAALALLALARPETAGAGAWTRPPGSVFVAAGASYFTVGGDFPYEESTISTYAEVGVVETVTLGGAVERKQPLGENAVLGDETTVSGFARFRLHEGPQGDPLSIQIGAEKLIDPSSEESRPRRDESTNVEARLQYGRGFGTALGAAFVDVQGAFRLNRDAAADELRLDVTAGLAPAPGWLLLLQSFNTIGLRNPDVAGELVGEDFDVYKIAPSVGYDLGAATILFGLTQEIGGRNLDALGRRWRVSFWREF